MDGCPGRCHDVADLDHVNLWVPSEIGEREGQRAFLLHHPYKKSVKERVHSYARAHGLEIEVNRPGDAWYGHGTLAVRMKIPGRRDLWPLERDAFALLEGAGFFWSEEEETVPEE
jgi:hypothetical protein